MRRCGLSLMGNDSHVAGRDIARNGRFGFAPSLALGLGTPTRLNFTYLHFSEYDVPDYGLPWINRQPWEHEALSRARRRYH